MKFIQYINKKKYSLITSFALFLFITPIVFAATSADFQTKAQKYISNNCAKHNLANDGSLFCFLYYKVLEHDSALSSMQSVIVPIPSEITSLQGQLASQSALITDLKQKLDAIENNQSLPTMDFTFFDGSIGIGANSPIVDAQDYTKVTLTFRCERAGLSLMVSHDQVNWLEQYNSNSDNCVRGGSVTLNTAGRYYMVSSGAIPSNTGEVHAIARFSNQ